MRFPKGAWTSAPSCACSRTTRRRAWTRQSLGGVCQKSEFSREGKKLEREESASPFSTVRALKTTVPESFVFQPLPEMRCLEKGRRLAGADFEEASLRRGEIVFSSSFFSFLSSFQNMRARIIRPVLKSKHARETEREREPIRGGVYQFCQNPVCLAFQLHCATPGDARGDARDV